MLFKFATVKEHKNVKNVLNSIPVVVGNKYEPFQG